MNKGGDILKINERTKMAMEKDKIDSYELLEMAITRLKSADYILHETHLAPPSPGQKVFELPLVLDGHKIIKYVKFIIPNSKNEFLNPGKLKKLLIDYHDNDYLLEVQYV
jgi:hypothetical protein